MNRFKRGLAILLSTCMIGGMMPLPASAEETVSENIVQTECIENTENLENAPSEDEKSSETDHETGSETESETVTDAETEGTAISAIQALIDALPDADSITEDNVENVTSQLDTIDEAKAELSDADISQLDLTRYDAAINKVMVLMGMKEENDSEIAVQANDSAGKTEQQSTDEAIVYQPAVETTDKYDIDDDGEKETVYEISNAGQLYWFAGLVNGTLDGVEQNTLANAILTANITVNENLLDSLQYDTEGNVSNGSDFITWTPIADWMGNRTTQYSGTFDGNNKTVSGLYFNGDSTCIGLFGSSESDGNIKNVGVVDSYFKGNDHVGGVCGNNAGTITNCYNAGNLTAIESSATIGGICGYNNGGTVANCYNTGTVTATGTVASVGGVCGCSTELILNCYNIGTVTAASSDADISGICGYNFGPIKNCYYLADTEDENGGKTAAQFASGEIAYLLSQGCTVGEGEDAVTYSGSVWGQALGGNGDTYPVLDSTKRVYQVDKYDGCEGKPGSSTKIYSNQSTSIYEEHKYEADTTDSTKHKCSICNGTEEHSFAYELVENGNAIKATCSECGATYTVKLTQPAATSDEKIVYDGTEKKAGTAIDSGNTGIETISENAITYAGVTNGTLSTYSTTAPKNAGTYKAKLTLGTGDNIVSIEINFTIEKAASPTIAGEEKSYAYSVGSGGETIGVDIAGKLPTDRGTTTYAVAKTDTEQLLSEVAVDTAGNLTYKVNQVDSTKVGKTAIITVTASMENYENAEYTLTISSITDKKTVEIKSGNTVSVDGSNVLTYGEKVSKLTLGNTVFVEAGTDNKVEGILSWSNPDEIPATGTTQAGWIFKPTDSRHYVELTGTAAITVAKATPIVVKVPTVAEREYNPDAALTDSDMTGGSVTGADGSSLAGTWSFTGTNIIPTVNNNGYQAVFTPNDTNNYNTVTRTITVKVTKATPVIAEKPTAGALTYGQKLSDSTLTGGKAAYQTADGTEITGTFAWKNDTTKPAVVDSQKTEYDVTFTPSDKDNYNAVDTKLTLSITKAAAPTNIPSGTLNIINGTYQTYTYDFAQLLPELSEGEYGTVSYGNQPAISLVSQSGYYYDPTIVEFHNGVLTLAQFYAKDGTMTGQIGTVKVKVTTTNYEDFQLTLVLNAVNQIKPTPDGTITASDITYGQTLSESTIKGKMKDDGKTVEGTFGWTNPSTQPDKAGDYQAEWTFTPAAGYEKYATVTGTVTVKVNKADPTFTAPTAQENLTYTGQEQALITAGMTDHGTMLYSLTENGTYSQDIPTGTDAGAYTVWYRVIGDENHNDTAPASVPVSIGKKPLTITGVTAASKPYSKPYDGTTNADISSVTFDGVNLNRGTDYTVTANFNDASVGNDKNITATVTLMDQAEKNYALEQSSFTTTGSITAKEVTVTITPNGGTYGSVTAAAAKLFGAVEGDNVPVTLTYTGNDYNSTTVPVNAGSYTVMASIADGNYTLTGNATADFVITPKAVTVSGITANDKVYDGTTNAVLDYSNAQFDGILENDKLTVAAKGMFEKAEAGKQNVAISDLKLSGASAANYVLAGSGNQTRTTATITAKEVPVTITPNGGTYGSVTAATAKLSGAVEGDNVPVTLTYTGNDYNSTTVPVNAGSYTVMASIADGNYTLTGNATADFVITPKAVTVSGITANDKVYDGTTNAVLDYSNAQFDGILENDKLTVAAKGMFEKAEAGKQNVAISDLKLGGDSAANYVLAESGNQTETTATITAKEVTVTPDNKSKVYEEKDPKLTYIVSGVLSGETLKGITLARAEGENAGEYDITATADAGANPNYEVTFAEGKFTINPKSIDGATVKLGKALTANGAEQTQTVEKVLLNDKELPADSYTVAGNTATDPGSHTLTITAKGNYTGAVEQTYVIVPAKAEDAPDKEITIGNGKVKVDIKFEGTVPPATLLTNKAELLAMLVDSGDITADELAQIANGASVDIVLTVKEANVSDEVKTAIAQAAKGYTIGQYLDISLFKYMTVNGSQQAGVPLHTTKDALTISVGVPDALINTNSAVNRTYCIVRNHEGTITVLDAAFDAAGKTLTFKTDRFSIYAIAYKDTAVPSSGSNPGSNNSSNDSETKKNEVAAPTPAPTPASTSKPSTITAMPQTGDTSNPTLYVVLLVASLLGLAVVFVCKKRNDK